MYLLSLFQWKNWRNTMTKKEAISIISKCTASYDANLCNKQLAFVYRDGNNRTGFVEITFRSNNFMHFTSINSKKHIKANAFYRDALEKRLKESDIQFKDNHLPQTHPTGYIY